MELNELPVETTCWYRKSETSEAYLSRDNSGLAAVVDLKNGKVEFGLYIPCAVRLKTVYFSNLEELIEALEDFKM